ncbi:hypothetical protein KAU30_02010, partial [Candidatus Bathyarchaeota archaeon]|nr:hypothetical protein [Candidatus Bathyarchaeota archaeon]
EIYQTMYAEEKAYKSIHVSPWPIPNEKRIDEEAEKRGDLIMAVITAVRRGKAEKRIPLNARVKKLTIYAAENGMAKMIAEGREDIAGTCKVANVKIVPEKGEGEAVKPYDIRFVAEY